MVQSSHARRTRHRFARAGLVLALLLGLGLTGCRSVMGLFQTTVEATPAPTAVPLPTAQPTAIPEIPALPVATLEAVSTATAEAAATAETAATASPTETPAAATATTTATDVAVATRIIPSREGINLPPGFGISVYISGLNDARMMTVGPDGALYVAERGAGRIVRLPDRDGDGVADRVEVVADGLQSPSSLDFYTDGSLYVGETTRILRLSDPDGDGVFQKQEVIVDGLPSGGHSTRTVLVSPDGAYLYVSVGSSCNVCVEEDERRATIMRYNPDGSGGEIYAAGLRNAVGITFRPGTNELWATNNGRDWLGDDQPPETIYIVEQGDDAGWPRCHAARIVDPDLGAAGACEGVSAPVAEMQAHTAPLGLRFYTGEQFPEEYRGDLFVALHGSWNRSTPVGYKVVRIPIENGEAGAVQDFAVGWLRENRTNWGRPVDVVTGADGSLFVSDDGSGVIYRIFYTTD